MGCIEEHYYIGFQQSYFLFCGSFRWGLYVWSINTLPPPPGGGGGRLKPHIEVSFKWMWFPTGIFQSPNFSLRDGSEKKFGTASSGCLLYQRFNGKIWHRSDDVRSRKDQQRHRPLSAVCCLRRRLTQGQHLKLQSRTADEKNPSKKRRIWRGRGTTSPAQMSMTAGAILFGVAKRVHIKTGKDLSRNASPTQGFHQSQIWCTSVGTGIL